MKIKKVFVQFDEKVKEYPKKLVKLFTFKK